MCIPAAPAVVGGVIIVGAGMAVGATVSWGIKKIFSDD